jgi:hypothetical protein
MESCLCADAIPMPNTSSIHSYEGVLKTPNKCEKRQLLFNTGIFSAQLFETRGLFEVARLERRRVIAVSRSLRNLYSDLRGDSQKLDVGTADHTEGPHALEQGLEQFPNALAFERRLTKINLLH